MATMLDAALKYLEYGYHPIPVKPRSKVPMVQWERFQKLPPTEAEIRKWWTESPNANIALVLGRDTFALDFDGGDDALALIPPDITLPECPTSRTGSGGYHKLFKGTTGDRVAVYSTNGVKPQVDVRGKGIIVVPPSIHPNGEPYRWITRPGPVNTLPTAPPILVACIAQAAQPASQGAAVSLPTVGRRESWVMDALAGVPEGQRDHTCARLAGYFLERGLPTEIVEALLNQTFARACVPAFPERDVRKTVQSIARRDAASGREDDRELEPVHIGRVLAELMTALDSKQEPKHAPTPFSGLNYMLNGGFAPGELIYLGARPGVGKTALALEVARSASRKGPVLFVSREMMNVALARRMVAQDGRIEARSLRAQRLTVEENDSFSSAFTRLSSLNLWLTDEVVTIREIADLVSRPPQGRVWDLLIVDYLQMVRAPKGIRDRRLQVEAVSQGLKTLALQFKVPVLCLSSLARPSEGNPRPTLASLRESGELEHDADVVLLLHRPDEQGEMVECNIEKNRDGGRGKVFLRFVPQFVSFEEAEAANVGTN